MKNRKKNTGLHLQASVWEADKKSIRERILSWIPVLYMILGVYGWMITALGVFQIDIQDAWLYGVLVLMGLWFGILYRIQKRAIKAESAGAEQTATEQKEPELSEKTVFGREENKQ